MDNYFLISIHQSWMSKLPIRNPLKLGVCMYKQVKLAYYCSNRVSHPTYTVHPAHCPIGGEVDLSIGDVLAFFTGTDTLPPLGLEVGPTLNFSAINVSYSVNLCNDPHTPNQVPHLADFKENFIYAMKNHGLFGLY